MSLTKIILERDDGTPMPIVFIACAAEKYYCSSGIFISLPCTSVVSAFGPLATLFSRPMHPLFLLGGTIIELGWSI